MTSLLKQLSDATGIPQKTLKTFRISELAYLAAGFGAQVRLYITDRKTKKTTLLADWPVPDVWGDK